MHKVRFYNLAAVWLLLIPIVSFSQQTNPLINSTLDGVVIDAVTGEPLSGASLQLEGVMHSTSTDNRGRFRFVTGQKFPYTIIVSYIGYKTAEVVAEGSPITIRLQPDATGLEEVVVVGYGTQRKRDVTGAVASLREDDFNAGANASVDQLILGRSAGVQVSQTSSEPGGGLSIRIRGASSVNAGNEPLYVIDGFPIDNSPLLAGGGVAGTGTNRNPKNPLNSLNPTDIESVEILKDASATAIYGSRGANGVILITTKKGSNQRTLVSYDAYAAVQSVARKMDLLSTRQYIDAINGLSAERGEGVVFAEADIAAIGSGTDWQNEIYRSAPIQNHNLSVSGGGEKTTFFTSFNYFNQQGVIRESGFDRYIGRVNIDRKLGERGSFGVNLNTSLVKDNNNVDGMQTNEDAGPIYASFLYDPTEPIYNADGSFRQSPNLTVNNPVSLIEGISSLNETNRTFGNAYLQYELIDGLVARLNVGSDRQTSRRDIYNSKLTFRGAPANGIANITTLERSNVLLEYTMNYQRQLNDENRLEVLGGVTYQHFKDRLFAGTIRNFPSDDLGTDNLSLGDTNNDDLSSEHTENQLLSYLGRVNYQLFNKFLFTASLRADGSSRFGANNKFGYFPSFAAGWQLAEETFIPEFFNELKLRASWGQTGNQEIANYTSLSTYVPNTSAIINDQPIVSLRPSRIANPDLKWETTEQLNVGVDASVLNGRLSATMDYFIKDTRDLLLYLPLPRSTGYSSVLSNVGRVRNEGAELLINAVVIDRKTFNWSVTANISHIRNNVKDLGTIGDIFTGSVTNVGTTAILREGYPVSAYYGYRIDGIFQTAEQVANSAQRNSRPGFPIFRDVNADGSITPDDQGIIGNPYPDFTYGLHNSFSYKRLQLDFFFQGQQGGDLLNINVIESMYPGNFRRNKLAEQVLDRWTPENPRAKWPSGVEPSSYGGGKVSNLVLQDASYLRLKNIQLSYALPQIHFVRSAKVYLAAQNVFTLTDYAGFDPEANSFGRSNERVDYSSYPLARTWLLGLNVSF